MKDDHLFFDSTAKAPKNGGKKKGDEKDDDAEEAPPGDGEPKAAAGAS